MTSTGSATSGRERGGYRGETVSYRLGYIIDDRCNNAESVYLYCIRDTGGQLSACTFQWLSNEVKNISLFLLTFVGAGDIFITSQVRNM